MSDAHLFLDTSALLRAYIVSEPYSQFVLNRMQAAGSLVVSRLAELEIPSALIQRGQRDHATRLSAKQLAVLLADFERDLETLAVVELSAGVIERASVLIRSYAGAG